MKILRLPLVILLPGLALLLAGLACNPEGEPTWVTGNFEAIPEHWK